MSDAFDFSSNLNKKTWVHLIDPRAKLLLILSFIIVPLFFQDVLYLTAIVVLILPIWLSAKIDLKPIKGLIYGIFIFSLTTILFSTFYNYGVDKKILFKFGPLVATQSGFYSGLILGYRVAIPSFVVLLLITTTDPAVLTKGLMKMHCPISVAFMILGSLRFFPIIFEELNNITSAQAIRGVKRSGIGGAWRSFKLASFPLMINSLRKSRVMGIAVESKGFGKRSWKNYYQDLTITRTDVLLIIFSIILLVGASYIRFGLGLGWDSNVTV